MKKKTIIYYVIVTILCMLISIGAPLLYKRFSILQQQYYTYLPYIFALRLLAPMGFGVTLYFWNKIAQHTDQFQRIWTDGIGFLLTCFYIGYWCIKSFENVLLFCGLLIYSILLLCAFVEDLLVLQRRKK